MISRNPTNLAIKFLTSFSENKICCPHHHGGSGRACLSGTDASKDTEYAFHITGNNIRFGVGVTAEIGYDVRALKAKRPVIITDQNVVKTRAFNETAKSLERLGLKFAVFDKVKVEPNVESMYEIIDHSRARNFDCFIGVGGGSSMDSAKVASLFVSNPKADLFDYVFQPFGKGLTPQNQNILPILCVPTTAGTGAENTAASIIDFPKHKCKGGIFTRCINPRLAIVDPLNVMSMPRNLAIYSGFDVLCHALESYTLIPYYKRRPRPPTPQDRPIPQGSNPYSDIWARETLKLIHKYFRRSIENPEDVEAKTNMLMASTFAGTGIGNAGVHLAHGLAYPISSQIKSYTDPHYSSSPSLVPHGLSVMLTAPADFEFTAHACPDKHFDAARLLGANLPDSDSPDLIGKTLADILRGFMRDFGAPNGLSGLGVDRSKIDQLAELGTLYMSKDRIAPRKEDTNKEVIAQIYEKSMTVY